jgi:ribulose-5-phosphate 4-epimerase/fuculose-1-phosphate aldolase
LPITKVEDSKLLVAKSVRMLENIQLLDMNGHVSCRVPGTDNFLINMRKASRASVALNDIVVCDKEGGLLEGPSEPPSEVYIHSEIYKRRPDVHSIVHGHPHWQTVLGIADIKFEPVFMLGSFIQSMKIYEKSSLVNLPEMGKELAEMLASDIAIQLRHHGNVVVGESVQASFAATVYVEEHAKKLYYASLAGRKVKVLEGENLKRTAETAWSPSIVQKVWDYYAEKANKNNIFDGIS